MPRRITSNPTTVICAPLTPYTGSLAEAHPPLMLISFTRAHPQRICTSEHEHDHEWKAGVTTRDRLDPPLAHAHTSIVFISSSPVHPGIVSTTEGTVGGRANTFSPTPGWGARGQRRVLVRLSPWEVKGGAARSPYLVIGSILSHPEKVTKYGTHE